MKLTKKRGFTLIELLVVVLIIGILAAVALPQYQKAVLKSRFSSLMPLAKTLSDSEEAYYLEHGTYTDDKTKLDVTTTDTNATVTLGNEEQHQYVKLTRSDINNQLTIYQKHSPNFAGETHCEALIDNTLANWLCADSLKGMYIGDKFGYSIYSLSTETAGTLARNYYNIQRPSLDGGDTCIADSVTSACSQGQYTNESTCIVMPGSGGDIWACRDSTFSNHSSCINNRNAGRGCGNSTFNSYSTCEGNAYEGCRSTRYSDHSSCIGNYANVHTCGNGTYDNYSSCIANNKNVCNGGKYTNSSYCEAYAANTCTGSYDSSSYCSGTYCPVGSPKQDGGTWQLCEGEEENGKTC